MEAWCFLPQKQGLMALFLFDGDLVGLALVTLVYGMLPPLPQ
jgi:carbonic anhydrase